MTLFVRRSLIAFFLLMAGCDSDVNIGNDNSEDSCAEFSTTNPLSIIGNPPSEALESAVTELVFFYVQTESRRREIGVSMSSDPESGVANNFRITKEIVKSAIQVNQKPDDAEWIRVLLKDVWPTYIYAGNKIGSDRYLLCGAWEDSPNEVKLDGPCNLRGVDGGVFFDMYIDGDIWMESQDQALSKLNRLLECKSGAGEHKDRL